MEKQAELAAAMPEGPQKEAALEVTIPLALALVLALALALR